MARMRTAEILLFLRVFFLAFPGSYGTTISVSSEVSSTVPGIQSTPSSLLDGSMYAMDMSQLMPYIQSTPSIILDSSTSAVVPTQSLISYVSGSNSSSQSVNSSVTFSMTSASMSLQDNLNTTVVVEGPSTPLMTSHIISTSPCSSSASTSTVGPPTTANTTKPSTTGGTEEPDAKSWMWIIIGASVGGVVVFMIVVIIVCRCLKRKRKNRNVVLPNDADANDKPGGNVAMESYNQSEERPKLAPSQ